METKNPIWHFLSIFALEAKDIVFFPLWWYSSGFLNLLIGLKEFISDSEKSLGFFVWVKNLFVPMYGQRDPQGFIISIFIRGIQSLARGFFLLVVVSFALLIAIVWLILPILIMHQIFFQLRITDINFFV